MELPLSDGLIIKAAQFAAHAHRLMSRDGSGLPFITHPARVAARVTYNEIATPQTVAAAWLHDTVEDTDVNLVQIGTVFGSGVASYVDQLTNVRHDKTKMTREERKAADRKRLAGVTPQAKIMKLIDRIDNLREMHTPEFTEKFLAMYLTESELLLNESLRGVDAALDDELRMLITDMRVQYGFPQ